jgi:hypothetical protein
MGDRVAALESRVRAEHDLDLPATLPHVWIALPSATREELRVLAVAWQRAFLLGGWALLLLITGALWWPAALAGAILWLVAVARGRATTDAFCAYLEAAVDVHLPSLAPAAAAAGERPGPHLTALARKGT